MIIRQLALALSLTLAPLVSVARGDDSDGSSKFSIEGAVLTYDTEIAEDGEIEDDDVEVMLALLQANPGITTLVLNSGGGSVWAGNEMSRIALDFGLNTEVNGECSSSCVNIFLAGDRRKMRRGSKIGFHSRSWSPSATKRYYDRWREVENWETPFDFASWIYRDTQAEMHEDLSYVTSRGVDPQFAIRMIAPRDKMWFPRREILKEAGFLTE